MAGLGTRLRGVTRLRGSRMRRRIVGVVGIGAIAVGLVACGDVVANPGPFTAISDGGAMTVTSDTTGPGFIIPMVGNPACSDGVDNDWDGFVDRAQSSANPDPGCSGIYGDDNERLDGLQESGHEEIDLDVAGNGETTFDPALDYRFPVRESCPTVVAGEPRCFTLQITGLPGELQGTLNPVERIADLPIAAEIQVETAAGAPDVAPGCAIGPITGEFSLVRIRLGSAWELIAEDLAVPAVTNCGVEGNAIVNEAFGLPGTADWRFTVRIVNAAGEPIAPPTTTTTTPPTTTPPTTTPSTTTPTTSTTTPSTTTTILAPPTTTVGSG
jgi:hypothetical protein